MGVDVSDVAGRFPTLHMYFQPIVDLQNDGVVGYEALARELVDGEIRPPSELFARAQETGREGELDAACRTAALDAAGRAGLPNGAALFVNTNPAAAGTAAQEIEHASTPPGVVRVLEITERAITRRPRQLLEMVDAARAAGWRIALDDLGANRASLSLLSFLQPDVIKLDLRLVQDRTDEQAAEIVNAAAVQVAATNALLIAEGIETAAHATLARSMGAQLGQGYLLGRPGPAHLMAADAEGRSWPRLSHDRADGTPFERLPAGTPVRRATKGLLIGISRWLERQAYAVGEAGVVLSTFERASYFTPATARRYTALARCASIVAAYGMQMPVEPAPGVRGARLDPEHPLAAEWDVLVIGPHFAGALVARDLGTAGPDRDRLFEYAVTYDRTFVLSAATAMLRMLPELPSAPVALDAAPAGNAQPPTVTVDIHGKLPTSHAADDFPARVAHALAASSNGLTITDARLPDLPVVYVNAAFERLSGYSASELLGRNARLLQSPDTDSAAIRTLATGIREGREVRTTLLNVRPDGTTWWNEMNVIPVRDAAGQITHWVGTQKDVTARMQAEEQVYYLAYHDALTGLANRRSLDEHLPAEIGRANRAGAAVALLYLDLDGFKAINDEHGHAVGDELLVAVARRLRGHLWVGDLLIRHGGDEFLMVASGLPADRTSTTRSAVDIADKLRRQLRRPFRFDGHTFALQTAVSIGISLWPHDAKDAPSMIDHADKALYRVKADGRDGTAVF